MNNYSNNKAFEIAMCISFAFVPGSNKLFKVSLPSIYYFYLTTAVIAAGVAALVFLLIFFKLFAKVSPFTWVSLVTIKKQTNSALIQVKYRIFLRVSRCFW